MSRIWDWDYALACIPLLGEAAVVTVEATLLAYLISLVGGLVVAIVRRSAPRPVSLVVGEVVEAIRSTPLLVQIYFLYFVGPQLGLAMPAWTAGLLALGIHYSCYTAEVYRAGLESVHRGQWEAATALNLGRLRTYKDIILPQAIPPMIPVFGNYLISMFKETPLLSVISIIELMARAKLIGNDYYRYTEPMTLVGLFFLAVSLVSAKAIGMAERRFNRKERRNAR
jgi:polar amino acid transport system permease protein